MLTSSNRCQYLIFGFFLKTQSLGLPYNVSSVASSAKFQFGVIKFPMFIVNMNVAGWLPGSEWGDGVVKVHNEGCSLCGAYIII